ncbi:hypothetical protein V5799_003779 [Amblyomma americanum]|uniref:Uncharacterized protein n=1 Tax=Amblyomma americanum TaxID=6943 RepID=A0AAQ4D800_AMBAM
MNITKRRKVNRAAAKSSAYKTVLKNNLQASLVSSIGKVSGSAGGTKVLFSRAILCQNMVLLRALVAAHGILLRQRMQSLWSCPFPFKMQHWQLSRHKVTMAKLLCVPANFILSHMRHKNV